MAVKKKTQKQTLLETIKMNHIYTYLTIEEKDEKIYREKLEEEFNFVCEKKLYLPSRICILDSVLYTDKQILSDEGDRKIKIIETAQDLRSRFRYYKESEQKELDKDYSINSNKKKILTQQLELAVDNITLKLDFLIDSFQKDVDKINLSLHNNRGTILPYECKSEINKQILENRKNIETHIKSIVCNDIDFLSTKDMRQLSSVYKPIFEKTFSDNIDTICALLADADFKKLSSFVIKKLNENVKLKKEEVLQSKQLY